MSHYAKIPTIYQMEASECGAASLAMIFAYFGNHLSLEQIRMETGISRDGCNAGNIVRVAKLHGLDCHAYQKKAMALKELKPPCILYWARQHFLVLEGFKGRYVWINDPAVGRRKISVAELEENYSGIVLTFQPTDAFKRRKKKNEISTFFLERIFNQYGTLYKLLLASMVLVLPGVLIPIVFQVLIDEVICAGNSSSFSSLAIGSCALIVLQTVLAFYRNKLIACLQKKVVLCSAHDFLNKLFRLPVSFYEQRYASDLSGRVSSHAKVSDFLSGELAETLFHLVVSIFYMIWLFIYSPLLTVAVLLSVMLNLLLIKLISERMAYSVGKLQQDTGRLSALVCTGLSITDTIKASGAEADYVERMLSCHEEKTKLEQKVNHYQQILNVIQEAVRSLTDVIILLLGGSFVISGEMTLGMLIAFIALFHAFLQPVDKLVGAVNTIQDTKIESMRVEDIMQHVADDKFKEDVKKQDIKTKLDGAVELRNVSFGYSPLRPPTVSAVSFRITCGSSVAIVGPSGCGKSTLAKVISGLYTPWNGEIYLDGIPYREIPNEIWNASVATVSQEITMFSGSIRDNLTMWNPYVSEEDMYAAAKDACIHEDIVQLPGAYEYRLTERASNLSGGQKQRMEIARALALNPTILILDEATSALDALVEKKIMDNIKRRGCTCIVIAHRLSAIRDCDLRIEMDKGKIVQRGVL